MKVTEHLKNAEKLPVSFEIIPPARGKNFKAIANIVEQLKQFNPPFIDVTSHCSEAVYNENPEGEVKKRICKKRPGTIGICGVIQNRFNIDTVAHILCRGFSREETEDALIELHFLGIENILALRGDGSNYEKKFDKSRSQNRYASDLVQQIKDLREGKYLENLEDSEPLDFCIGVAGYPEKHFEAPNLQKDIEYLKQKIDAGADYIVTQMFFNNDHYYNFVKECRKAGITVPILPGIKILKTASHLTSLPKYFNIEIPDELVQQIHANPENAKQIGVEWAKKQVEGLIEFGVPCLHFYVMNDTESVVEVINHCYNLDYDKTQKSS